MVQLYNIYFFLLAQTQVVGGAEAAEAAAGAAEVAEKAPSLFSNLMFPALMAVMLLYFIMMAKPQQSAGKAKSSELLATLKKNDQVVTAGGILGTVVNVRSDAEYITLRIDDSSNTRMQVLASSVVRVVSDDDAS